MTRPIAMLRRLGRDVRGLALLEFAFTLPILLAMCLTGAELTNYVIARMRISQIALQLADNAARIGAGSQLQAKKITELDINDLFTGANLQSGDLGLIANGRMILSSVEPDPANSGKYRIRWQRCKGSRTGWNSSYGAGGATNLTGVGPDNQQIIAPASGVTMFVEVRYQYSPLLKMALLGGGTGEIRETASMMVRDRRDTTGGTNGVYTVARVTASTC